MNEEEIKDIIKDFLELREIHSSDNMIKSYLSIYKEAVQELLNLYNKEKEKNFKRSDMIFLLKAENTKLKDEVKALENADLTTVYMNGFYDGEKKWKNKIQKKIEEISGMNEIADIEREIYNRMEYVIEILLELVEENKQ